MFSAYDIKKILPRAVFALVGISLSWALMNILINFMGFLGDSIETIILDSFSAASSQLTSIGLDAKSSGWFIALTTIAVGSAGLGLVPVLGLILAGVTGVGLAFVIILLRRVALVALVVLAPLAIAMSVLPQTEKIFKNWWEWFFKLLLMYPFLMAMFAFSRVAAGIFSITGSDSSGAGITSAIYQFAAIAILIAPYFLVGKAFSFAGGTIGKLAGVVNNRDKGLIDKAKKYDQKRVGLNRAKAKDGRYAGNNFATAGLNAGLRRVMNPKSLASLNKQKRVAALVSGAAQAEATYAEAYKAGFEGLSGDAKKILAYSKGTDRGAKEYIRRQAEEEYDKAKTKRLRELEGEVLAGRITSEQANDQADVAARMARRMKEEGLERELAMLSSVGGVNATSARLGLKSLAVGGELSMADADQLSSQLATATGTPFGGWDQRSRVMAESTAATVAKAGQGAFDKSLEELTTKKAMAEMAGRTTEAAAYGVEIDNLIGKGGKMGLSIPETTAVPHPKPGGPTEVGKTEQDRPGFYTGSQSRSRVLATDAAYKAAKAAPAALAGDAVAQDILEEQGRRVAEHVVMAAGSAAGAVGEKARNPLNQSELPGAGAAAEPERQRLRNEVIGKKDGSGR